VISLERAEEDTKERLVALKDRIRELQAVKKNKTTDAAAMLRASAQIEKTLESLTAELEEQARQLVCLVCCDVLV